MANEGSARRESRKSRGGGVPGAAGQPAFSLSLRDPAPVPILIAVPHAGRVYPEELAALMRNPAAASLRLEDRFTDLVGEAVARETGASLLVAHAPRAMIDLNRAPDDVDWDMVAGGAPEPRRLSAGRRARSGLAGFAGTCPACAAQTPMVTERPPPDTRRRRSRVRSRPSS